MNFNMVNLANCIAKIGGNKLKKQAINTLKNRRSKQARSIATPCNHVTKTIKSGYDPLLMHS
jgi:hypothetical protein